MKNISKISITVSIILLFLGFCIHPVFAVEDETSVENENPNTISGEVYENTNCFVRGSVSEAVSGIFLFGKGDIVFGWKWSGESHPSSGWIYTSGFSKRWEYEGSFWGDVRWYQYTDWWSGLKVTRYVGIEGFRGLVLGGHCYQGVMDPPCGGHCWFMGFAKHVKIVSV